MDFKQRSELSVVNGNIKSCFIETPKGTLSINCDVIFGVIYKPTRKSVDIFIGQLILTLQSISGENKPLYLMGGFNINLLNLEHNQPTNNFIDTLYSYSLTPHITKPTHTKKSTATLIDNIFANNSMSEKRHLSCILYTDIGDHLPVFCFGTCSDCATKE